MTYRVGNGPRSTTSLLSISGKGIFKIFGHSDTSSAATTCYPALSQLRFDGRCKRDADRLDCESFLMGATHHFFWNGMEYLVIRFHRYFAIKDSDSRLCPHAFISGFCGWLNRLFFFRPCTWSNSTCLLIKWFEEYQTSKKSLVCLVVA